MRSSTLLAPDRIALAVPATDRDAVLARAARVLAAASGLPATRIALALTEREALSPTALGHGVALPHARMPGLDTAVGALLRLQTPVAFGAADGAAVDLVVAMLVPDTQVQAHLSHLAELAERLGDARVRAALRDAPDARAVIDVMTTPLPQPA